MGKITDMFKEKPTLEQLEEEDNRTEREYSIAKKRVMIAELEARGRRWQEFSKDGTKKLINWDKIMSWLKGSK